MPLFTHYPRTLVTKLPIFPLEDLLWSQGVGEALPGRSLGPLCLPCTCHRAKAATSDLRTSDFDIAGSHGGSPVLRCRVGDRAEYRTDVREREETVEERYARLDREKETRLQSMPRWAGREAYEAEQRRQRELETIGAGSPSSVGPLPTSDTMQAPSHAGRVGADTCGLDAGDGGLADVRYEGGDVGGLETVGADSRAESSDDGEECEAAEAIVHGVVVGICAAGTDGGIHGGEEEMGDEGSVPLDDDATQIEEEGATVHAGRNAPSVRDGETGGHVEEDRAAVDMSLAIIVRPPLVRDVETGGHVHSGRPVSFSAGGYSGEMPRWDGGEPGECTPTPLRPEQLERLGTEDPFPFTSGQSSPPAWAPVTPRRVTDSLRRDYDRGQGLFARGPSGEGGPAAGANEAGRPSVHTAGRILGLDRVGTRRTERMVQHSTRSAMEDRRQGVSYTSGEDDLHMPQGSRHHGSSIDLDLQIAAEEQWLAELIRERERRSETEAQAEEADTETEPIETAACRERHRRAAVWTRDSEHNAVSEDVELLIIQAWRTEVEGDLLGFVLGSVEAGHRQPIVGELQILMAQLLDDLSIDIISHCDESLAPHILSLSLTPYLQWSACLEGNWDNRTYPSHGNSLNPAEIIDILFFDRGEPTSKNEEEEDEEEEDESEDTLEEDEYYSEYSENESGAISEEEEEEEAEGASEGEEAGQAETQREDSVEAER
ncbi:hypothetical protein CBR_g17882 [Chara braunii]|uniref:Uncharacterized protein n=1 Tax=Chara braunii TaxID=69332 RepID=A0A388KVY5_CHABU|nr:hypothetical protein CBR_g17882 [Chara braunii]|eukprot:GBG74168.1 hypothetical protein CBR_g17882 [Chara braunii]